MHQKPQTFIIAFLLMLTASSATLMADFYVIPVAPKTQNIITVAPTGADFTSPLAAMNSINDSSEQNPYLILVAAGTYDLGTEQLVMKPHVSLIGEGIDETVIRSDVGHYTEDSAAAFVIGADRSMLNGLTLENNSSDSYGITLHASDVNMTLENLRLIKDCVSAETANAFGIDVDASHVTLRNVDVRITDASNRYRGISAHDSFLDAEALTMSINTNVTNSSHGLYLNGTQMRLSRGVIDISAQNAQNYGFFVHASAVSLDDVNLTVLNGSTSRGIYLNTDARLNARAVSLSTYGTGAQALYKSTSAEAAVLDSTLSGTANSLYASGSSADHYIVLAHSVLDGLVSGAPALCAVCTNGSSDALDPDCRLP